MLAELNGLRPSRAKSIGLRCETEFGTARRSFDFHVVMRRGIFASAKTACATSYTRAPAHARGDRKPSIIFWQRATSYGVAPTLGGKPRLKSMARIGGRASLQQKGS